MTTTAMSEVEQLCQRVASATSKCLPHGSLTKRPLALAHAANSIDMRFHTGVVTYDPSEFLITAKAGTPLRDLVSALAEYSQYLPFDPLFVAGGSTLGGCVAAGISGPNRLLYGGLRDFVMEVEMIDGLGNLVRGGGKVVKNAAGFDLPKLVVGSYGRLGILTEVTIKVFPQPASSASMWIGGDDNRMTIIDCLTVATALQAQPLPIAAIEFASVPDNQPVYAMLVRFAGPVGSMPRVLERARQIVQAAAARITRPLLAIDGDKNPPSELQRSLPTPSQSLWRDPEVDLPEENCLVRIATNPNQASALAEALAHWNTRLRFSNAAAVAWLEVPAARLQDLDLLLQALGLSAVVIADGGAKTIMKFAEDAPTIFLGNRTWCPTAERIQRAIDPSGRFASYSSSAVQK
ncbi:MAG: FAD-binding protein [Pirellulaceae bacterium]